MPGGFNGVDDIISDGTGDQGTGNGFSSWPFSVAGGHCNAKWENCSQEFRGYDIAVVTLDYDSSPKVPKWNTPTYWSTFVMYTCMGWVFTFSCGAAVSPGRVSGAWASTRRCRSFRRSSRRAGDDRGVCPAALPEGNRHRGGDTFGAAAHAGGVCMGVGLLAAVDDGGHLISRGRIRTSICRVRVCRPTGWPTRE